MFQIILLILGMFLVLFSIRFLCFLLKVEKISLETYSKDVPDYIKYKIDSRNKQRIKDLW